MGGGGEASIIGPHAEDAGGGSFARAYAQFAAGYWRGSGAWPARLLVAALALLTVGQVGLAIWANFVWKALFDALEQRSTARFLMQVAVFGLIVAATMGVTALHFALKRRVQLGWRRWLTDTLVDEWLVRGRHQRLRFRVGEHDNPDGRIAEDVRIATELAVELAHSLVYCLLMFLCFVGILWTLSGILPVQVGGRQMDVSGHMVWVAVLYAGLGSTLGLVLGRPLVDATNRLQTSEADLRFGLAEVREDGAAIALGGGEARERRAIGGLFEAVARRWARQSSAFVDILFFTSAYGQLLPLFPILVSAPRYIAGVISLGALMQTAQAFQQVAAALSWPVDNLKPAAQWRASAERVLSLHRDLRALDAAEADAGSPVLALADGGSGLRVDGLTLADADGHVLVRDLDLVVPANGKIALNFGTECGLALQHALAGLWPWGMGRIVVPEGGLHFLVRRPYLPPGALRAVLAYPGDAVLDRDEQARSALAAVGLARLGRRLDEDEDWEAHLGAGDRQRLGFARALYQRPGWIVAHEAADALAPAERAALLRILAESLPASAILLLHGGDAPCPPYRLVEPEPAAIPTRSRQRMALDGETAASGPYATWAETPHASRSTGGQP